MTDQNPQESTMPDMDETLNRLLSRELGILPEEFESLFGYLRTTRRLLRFYAGEATIHFENRTQQRLETLTTTSDLLVLEYTQLQFEARQFAAQAHKMFLETKPFTVDKTRATQFRQAFEQLQQNVTMLQTQLHDILKELKRMQDSGSA